LFFLHFFLSLFGSKNCDKTVIAPLKKPQTLINKAFAMYGAEKEGFHTSYPFTLNTSISEPFYVKNLVLL